MSNTQDRIKLAVEVMQATVAAWPAPDPHGSPIERLSAQMHSAIAALQSPAAWQEQESRKQAAQASEPYKQPHFTPEEKADGNRGIRWVTAEGVAGRPTTHDVRIFLSTRGLGCECQECKTFYAAPARAVEPLTHWVVLAPCGEGVVFADGADAEWTATGKGGGFGKPAIGEAFRECYGHQTLTLHRIGITTTPAAKAGKDGARWTWKQHHLGPRRQRSAEATG